MAEIENTITLEELRRRQLARLKTPSSAATTESSIPDESFDNEYQHACAEAENGGWEIPNRFSWEAEHKAWLEKQRNRKQPENTEPEPFIVGENIDRYGYRTAIPAPRWPAPGELMTREIERTYHAEWDLCQKAAQALTDITYWTRTRLREPDYWDAADRNGNVQNRYAETWAWLMGIWQGRKIQPPTETQLETWARDWDREIKKSSRASQKQDEPEPS